MEDEDDVEDVEFGASHSESQSNEDGMEDDAEFEDEDSGHLCGVVFSFVSPESSGSDIRTFSIRRILIEFDMISCVAQMVFAGCMSLAIGGASAGALLGDVLVCCLVMFFVGIVFVSKGCEAHGH